MINIQQRRECKSVYYYTGVFIQVDPFVIGSRTFSTCGSNLDESYIDLIWWSDLNGTVLANSTSGNQLELVFDPVNDSLTLQGAEFICSVSAGGRVENQSFQVVLARKLGCIITLRASMYTTLMLWNLT